MLIGSAVPAFGCLRGVMRTLQAETGTAAAKGMGGGLGPGARLNALAQAQGLIR